jgi:molybdate transport system ATP-binding protein
VATLALDIALRRPTFELRVAQSFELGGITALFGPSGSGKTTLLRVIAGLESAASGSVRFGDIAWQEGRTRIPTHRRRVGYVFQDARLFSHLTVEQNVRFAGGRVPADAAPTVDFGAIVEALELEQLLPRRTPSLSGGEQQRVAIARALLAQPRLLLMDEPLSSLDVNRKREILPLIEQLPARFGVPVLYVTHNLDEVARLATDVALISAGRIVATDRVGEMFERADLESLLGGLDGGVVVRTRVTDHRDGIATLALGAQQLRTPAAQATVGATRRVRIHARDVAIATERPRRLSIRNVLAARVLRVDPGTNMNVEVLLDVDGEHLRSRITRDAAEELELAPGQQVFALIKSVALENVLLS